MSVPTGTVALFATCINDMMFPDTPKAVLRLLERLLHHRLLRRSVVHGSSTCVRCCLYGCLRCHRIGRQFRRFWLRVRGSTVRVGCPWASCCLAR